MPELVGLIQKPPLEEMIEPYKEEIKESLAHHGVEGMKWGQQNGPPYPLSRQGSGIMSRIKDRYKKHKQAKLEKERIKKKKATLEKARIAKQKRAAEEKRKKADELNRRKSDAEDLKKNAARVHTTRKLKSLTDDQIKRRTDRLREEETLRKLSDNDRSKIEKVIESVLENSGKTILTTVATGAGLVMVRKALVDIGGIDPAVAKEITTRPKK